MSLPPSVITLRITNQEPAPPKPMTAEELEHAYPLGVELTARGVDRLLSLIHPARSPFPSFRFEHQVQSAPFGTGTWPRPPIEVWLLMRVNVYERDNPGEPIAITFEERVTLTEGQCNRRWIQELVRRFLLKAYEHELDEHLLVAGVRVFDPHVAR